MTPLILERTIPASPRTLFEAWLDPTALATFMCPAPSGTVASVAVDARVGGAFEIVMVIGDKHLPHRGEYVEIERYTRLVFTWLSHHAGEGSQVTITFAPRGAGTHVVLTHIGLAEDKVGPHTQGWTNILAALSALVVNATRD